MKYIAMINKPDLEKELFCLGETPEVALKNIVLENRKLFGSIVGKKIKVEIFNTLYDVEPVERNDLPELDVLLGERYGHEWVNSYFCETTNKIRFNTTNVSLPNI
ncbi:hypothetical protein BGP77_11580 [Saccharospirillum sp. MSK14-1]|uniref:hypothetical protein n=1 Tax=Saccharospirillum sp. MSK14-1 TaxID=1897632 RepID=UPI000D346102|nr:hypothetical protein [Saccharospirillum sp. MSK14-1]PTY38579.1 hypothetical protein BGP77_11580 [Saccharospirillum sp. MSK14-1]